MNHLIIAVNTTRTLCPFEADGRSLEDIAVVEFQRVFTSHKEGATHYGCNYASDELAGRSEGVALLALTCGGARTSEDNPIATFQLADSRKPPLEYPKSFAGFLNYLRLRYRTLKGVQGLPLLLGREEQRPAVKHKYALFAPLIDRTRNHSSLLCVDWPTRHGSFVLLLSPTFGTR